MPSAKKLQAVASVLGLEFYFGPPRAEKSGQTGGSLSTSEAAGAATPGLEPVRDRQLAELLAIIADHWERENEYGRRYFLDDIKLRLPALFQTGEDGGGPAGPGRRSAQGDSKDGFPGKR